MELKNSLYRKQIVKKKMKFIIFYGIIFLISTMAYYFVNNSKAQNILKLETIIIDEEAVIEETKYELKATENDEIYTIMLPAIQNGFVVQEYTLISKEEYNKLTNKEEDKKIAEIVTENKITNEITEEINTTNEIIEEVSTTNEIIEEVSTTNEIIEEVSTTNEDEEEKEEIRILPNKDFELSKEEVENKEIYLLAQYDYEEIDGEKLYNKVISASTEKNSIIISGFMPQKAEVKVTEVDVTEIENKIKDKTENEVELKIAYDIKIVVDEEEYEPNEFDEEVKVEITDIENKNINIWHIKDDENIEIIEPKNVETKEKQKIAKFNTAYFSVYGVEVLEENSKENNEQTQVNEVTNEIANEETNQVANEVVSETINEIEKKDEGNAVTTTAKKAPKRAATSNLPDSTLEIDDYNSDYYYYMGKNYTDNISETNNTYSSSNLVRVEINYYGFAQGETDSEKKGRISLDETEDIIKNIKCLPVVNGNISIELMDNPFMNKPAGYGFGGWTTTQGTITTDSHTNAQTLTLTTSGNVTVNVYANWETATVVYVNGQTGSDNGNHSGLTEEEPFGSWGKAFEYISTNDHNTGDRETNIIVVTGNVDCGINYTKPVNKVISKPATVTYNSATPTNGGEYIIVPSGTTNNALTASGTSITTTNLTTTAVPPDEAIWIVSISGNTYTFRNKATNQYLTYYYTSSTNYGLRMQNGSQSWTNSNNRFYIYGRSNNQNRYHYIRYDNRWTIYRSRNTSNTPNQLGFLTYNAVIDENAEDIVTYTQGAITTNSYYSSNTNSVPVTVTSLYGGVDYREDATINLTATNAQADFNIYKDFQMNHVQINSNGYTSNEDGDTYTNTYAWLVGHNHNVRLGRGIQSTNANGATFANVLGGCADAGSTRNDDNAYKLVVESGRYSSIQGFNGSNDNSSYDYYGTVYLTLGNDIDRVLEDNNSMTIYYETAVNSGANIVGKNSIREKALLINVKSGKYGTDYFDTYGGSNANSAYAGIYVGGYGTTQSGYEDISDRYIIVEGGLISNIVGGLKAVENSGVETRIYVKGGEIYNIVGGAGISASYEDRIIQVTGGLIRYSISGGANGVSARSNNQGRLYGDTLVYVGGNAKVGSASVSGTLYGVEPGSVLGAGNGNYNYRNNGAGQVNNSHVIINDNAQILNNVYGGGNYGIVGTSNTAVKVDILGGTIDKNVFGGANQNGINGSTTVNVKGGQVKGAVYGGSNVTGTISTTSTINVTGGTLGQTTNTTDNGVLFGGGKGSDTRITGNATVNIYDTDENVNIYGAAYGGSEEGRIGTGTTSTASTFVNIADDPSNSNTISIVGNVFGGGKGVVEGNTAYVYGNSIVTVDGSNLTQASIFGGNDQNGITNGEIKVTIGENNESKVLNVYGGGNIDATGTEADCVYVYLKPNANVTNAFNGGQSADLTTGGITDTTRAIYLQGGHADNIFGGSNKSGTVTASHVYIESGTADNVYGGNNEKGQTTTSNVFVQNGTVTNVYGGGLLATTPTTNVNLTGGTITNGFGGGNSANVTTSNITLNGATSENIYGGSNEQGTVNNANVTISSGTVTSVYGGNNAGGNTVDTNVLVTSTANNVYGGGNEAITSGNTYVNLNNATILEKEITVEGETIKIGGNVYGGGNGSAAVVNGNSTTVVQGTTRIQNDLFGGGNAAANGTQANQNSTVKLYITGGRIEGDVYGAANTSVVYGNTDVKIGKVAVNNNTLAQGNIFIGGTVFGGGKSNTAGSESYDFDFESVTRDANIDINAQDYDNGTTYTFDIKKSVFGSGNAAKISGNGYVNISNYGTNSNLKENISIQRATKVVLDNCKIYLSGTTDTTNEIATAVYTFNRIGDVVLKNNTTLYLESGVNIVSKLESVDSSNTKAQVTIGNNGVTNRNVDNRLFLLEGKNVILRTEDGNNGEVSGMTYVGIFKGIREKAKGIYDIDTYADGATIPEEVQELFERNSYVQGKHYASHNIEVDGFYTNYDEDGKINTAYIVPTPEDADYYQWIVGKVSTDIYYEDIELIATKYATTAAYVLQLDGLSFPNTTIKVSEFDVSDLSNTITLNTPNTIPNIAATAQEADTRFGLTMTAGNSGWQTKGTTNFLNNETTQEGFSGTTEYLSDNSNTTPTFSFYMDHSKNISSTEVLGTVKIKLEANYVENEEMKRRNAYIIIKLTTNNTLKMDKDYYEGAITPGKQYGMFPTTATTITKKSSFSAYYSLYLNEYSTTKYYEGFTGMYYHALLSSCVLPAKTKITLIDKSLADAKYYYYIVTQQDEENEKKVYRFTDFKAMDSTQEPYNSDGVYYNQTTDLLFEEFIVQVDFEDITLASSLIGQNFLIQLRDAFDSTPTITVNTAQYPMLFSVYNNLEANATLTLNTNKRVIHMGDVINMDIESEYVFNKNENNDTVYDTTNIDNQLGLRITVSSGSRVLTATQLEGIYIKYKNSNYYPRSDGSYRIKIADAVANVLAEMELHTEIGKLETGTYTIKVESFGSTDGTYFSTAIAEDSKDIQIVSSEYGFVVELDDNAVLIDKVTGKNKNDSNDLNFNIGYSGNFDEPKIVVSLYRRKYDQIYSYEYEQLDLSQYVTNNLVSTSKIGEYLVTERVQESQNYTLTMKNNLRTGTYKIVFSLYDGEVLIADMDKTVIIK